MNIVRTWYSWKPDLPDNRDWRFSKFFPYKKKLPVTVDLRTRCTAVEDQKALGSCTAQAIVGNLEFLNLKSSPRREELSRLYVYYNTRVILNTVHWDSGGTLRDGIKSVVRWGVCAEPLWPYNIDRFATKPSSNCYTDGLRRLAKTYYRLNNLQEMKNCISSGFPFVFGFMVYQSFEQVGSNGIVNMPRRDEKALGGHAVMAVGYNDHTRRFIIRNSWGANWGMRGYFTMPYEYLTNRNLSDDFWTIRK